MVLISPSRWLAGLVAGSFLSNYLVRVVPNTIDVSVFRPLDGDFRVRHNIENRFMILGVASPWTNRKGLDDFIRLSNDLDSAKFAIVLVGLSDRQIKEMPDGIIGLSRTDSPQELAEIYTSADAFFNPTVEDNYPTVNLEAEACGTPVVTYDTGGCSETIHRLDSMVVAGYKDALKSLLRLAEGC